jgi:hypothetical protein
VTKKHHNRFGDGRAALGSTRSARPSESTSFSQTAVSAQPTIFKKMAPAAGFVARFSRRFSMGIRDARAAPVTSHGLLATATDNDNDNDTQ